MGYRLVCYNSHEHATVDTLHRFAGGVKGCVWGGWRALCACAMRETESEFGAYGIHGRALPASPALPAAAPYVPTSRNEDRTERGEL